MIHFFADHSRPIRQFLASWAGDLAERVRFHSYYEMPLFRSPPPAAYIFSDLELLPPWKRAFARNLCRRIERAPEKRIVLNRPDRYLSRFRLLRLLHERGVNEFRVFRIDELDADIRFPVFLRSELNHSGAIGGLLHSRDDVARALRGLSFGQSLRKSHLMFVEYSDCADAGGVFRKYSAMNVQGTLIPRHVLFSNNWVTKKPDLVSDATVEEEGRFLEQFPHRDQLAEFFRWSGIDYGRIDYGVKDGRLQVWEINTNPIIVPVREDIAAPRLASQSRSARCIMEALMALANGDSHNQTQDASVSKA